MLSFADEIIIQISRICEEYKRKPEQLDKLHEEMEH